MRTRDIATAALAAVVIAAGTGCDDDGAITTTATVTTAQPSGGTTTAPVASRPASALEAHGIVGAIVTSDALADPQGFTVEDVRVVDVDPGWAAARLEPRKAFRATLDVAQALLRREGDDWRIVNIGDMGCDLALRPVLETLFGGCSSTP